MTLPQITIVQREGEAVECLPLVLIAAGVKFRKVEVAELGKLPQLPESETVVFDAAADRWGLAAACHLRIRRPGFTGAVLIGSFERASDLALAPDGDILSTPGVTFVRLPVIPPAHISVILSTLARPDATALNRASTALWQRRIYARAKLLTHQRGGQIGPLRLQLQQLIAGIGSGPSGVDPAAVQDCAALAGRLPDWAARCDALLHDAREQCEATADVEGLASLAQELTHALRLLSLDAQGAGDTETLCRRALNLIDSIDEASMALDALTTPNEEGS
jgi:hypothetical protein